MQAVGHCLRAVMTMIQVRVTGATARRRITETGTISTWVIIIMIMMMISDPIFSLCVQVWARASETPRTGRLIKRLSAAPRRGHSLSPRQWARIIITL